MILPLLFKLRDRVRTRRSGYDVVRLESKRLRGRGERWQLRQARQPMSAMCRQRPASWTYSIRPGTSCRPLKPNPQPGFNSRKIAVWAGPETHCVGAGSQSAK
jgi:hypothetical protein